MRPSPPAARGRPAASPRGETRAEVEQLIREALEAHIEDLQEHGETVPRLRLQAPVRYRCRPPDLQGRPRAPASRLRSRLSPVRAFSGAVDGGARDA